MYVFDFYDKDYIANRLSVASKKMETAKMQTAVVELIVNALCKFSS